MERVFHLRFESPLTASPEAVWQWITSARGISAEMQFWLRMTMPDHVSSLTDLYFTPGEGLFRSRLLLLGLLSVDYSDLALLELNPGEGFIEQSPMGSMRSWCHVRRIVKEDEGKVRLAGEAVFPASSPGFEEAFRAGLMRVAAGCLPVLL